MEELKRRFERIELNQERYHDEMNNLFRQVERRISEIERKDEGQDQRLLNHSREVAALSKHLDRMENTLLKEFKISQDIMKSMLDHEWAIDKAKLDMKMELERREAEMLNNQRDLEIEMKREAAALRRKLLIQLGTIGLPILTVIATVVSKYLESMFP